MTDAPYTRFVVFGVMRSGSNLLERFLDQYDGLACHGELFNPVFIGRSGQVNLFGTSLEQRKDNPESLLAAMDRALPDQVNGLRYFPAHDAAALDVLLDDPRCAKIMLTRDPLESYVSQRIAEYSDIWLIGSEKDRMALSVDIVPEAFETYHAERNAFISKIRSRLKASGQKAFEIDYSELLDLGKVNRLALAIGARAPMAALHQPIKRQNPAPLQAKIANYADVYQALGLPAPRAMPAPESMQSADDDVQWVWPRHYYTCDDLPLAFVPLLSNTKQPIIAWLDLLPGQHRTGKRLAELQDWIGFHQGATVFSVLHHPLDRIYDVFMNKIFSTAPDAFQKIRRILERRYQIYLPEDSRSFDRQTYTLDDHRLAFQQFLVFLAANLKGETEIRQDGNWLPQARLVDIFAEILPINRTILQSELDRDIPALERDLGLPTAWAQLQRYPHARPVYQLADIVDAQTEALARKAYHEDYTRFGFGDWQPGQAAFDASLPVRIS